MDPRKRLIATLNARINGHAEENRGRLTVLGEYLAKLGEQPLAGTELEEGRRRVWQLQKKLPDQRRQARSIVQLVERHRAKKEKLAENRRHIARLEKENDGVCGEIGRAAFAAYRNIPTGQDRFGDIFTRLEELDRELHQAHGLIASLESRAQSGSLFARAGIRGRLAYLKSTLALKNRALSGSFERAGREICESEFAGQIQDETFSRAIRPYTENRKRIRALEEQKEQLETQQEEIWAELKKMGAEKSHEKKVRELEKVIAETERSLKEGCLDLGLRCRKSPVAGLAEDEEIAAILRDIGAAEKEMARDRKQIKRLEADLQAEEIFREMEKTRDRIEGLNREIADRRQDVAALEQSLQEREAERNRLLKRRGAESTLLAIEAPKQKGKNSE